MGVNNLGGAMNPPGLETGSRIWSFFVAVEAVEVESPGLHLLNNSMVIALLVSFQVHNRLSRRDNSHFHLVHKWCPYGKAALSFTQVVST
jgi:hypothetical protein